MEERANEDEEAVLDWGKQLQRIIAATEARVANYKQLTQNAYKAGDQELVAIFKPLKKDEEKWLKARREEKTSWNQGLWYFD